MKAFNDFTKGFMKAFNDFTKGFMKAFNDFIKTFEAPQKKCENKKLS